MTDNQHLWYYLMEKYAGQGNALLVVCLTIAFAAPALAGPPFDPTKAPPSIVPPAVPSQAGTDLGIAGGYTGFTVPVVTVLTGPP